MMEYEAPHPTTGSPVYQTWKPRHSAAHHGVETDTEQAVHEATEKFTKRVSVVHGVAQGTDKLHGRWQDTILVYAEDPVAAVHALPSEFNGYPVQVKRAVGGFSIDW